MAKARGKAAVALVKVSNYAITKHEPQELLDVVRTNVGDGSIGAFDLDRISLPTGGSTTWEYETIDGEASTKELVGVLVGHRIARAFWKESGDDAKLGVPPDCRSDDAVIGIGEPGGSCEECPLAKFGSADDGRGQRCKQGRMLFLITDDVLLPYMIVATPSSLQNMKKYLLRLSSHAVRYFHVVTKLELEKKVNPDGKPFAVIKPSIVERLSDETKGHFEAVAKALAPVLAAQALEQKDVSGIPDKPDDDIPL